MHGRSVDGYTISVQVKKHVIFSLSHHLAVISNIRLKWARNAPSAKWRLGGPTTTPNPPPLPPHGSSSRRRSMSPAHTHPALSRGRSPPSSYYTEPPSTTKRYSYNNERSRSRPRSPPFSSSRYEQGQQKYTSAYAYQKSTNSPPPEAKKNSPTTQTSLQQQSTRQSYLHSPPPFL